MAKRLCLKWINQEIRLLHQKIVSYVLYATKNFQRGRHSPIMLSTSIIIPEWFIHVQFVKISLPMRGVFSVICTKYIVKRQHKYEEWEIISTPVHLERIRYQPVARMLLFCSAVQALLIIVTQKIRYLILLNYSITVISLILKLKTIWSNVTNINFGDTLIVFDVADHVNNLQQKCKKTPEFLSSFLSS